MTPQLAAAFVYQALLSDTAEGQLNDPSATTNPSGVASFVTNRLSSYFRNAGLSPETFPYAVLRIESYVGRASQRGGAEDEVTAVVEVYDEAAQQANRLVKICNALFGNSPTASNGVSTFGIVRCNLGPARDNTLTDSTFNPLGIKTTDTWLDSMEPVTLTDGSADRVGVAYRIKFNLTT